MKRQKFIKTTAFGAIGAGIISLVFSKPNY